MPQSWLTSSECALQLLSDRADKTKSLNGEDMLLMPTLINAARGQPGTFVELGAFTGHFSNTKLLEKCFGWSGLLIEANPTNFNELAKAPRPHSRKVHSAVCATRGHARITTRGGTVSGQLEMLAEEHKRAWGFLNNGGSVQVPCQPLSALMRLAGLDELEGATFLSLDVEGAEELVLSTVRPSAFRVIMVEMDGLNPAKDARVERRILADGLRLAPELTRQINGSKVFVQPHVKSFPLPPSWYTSGRLAGRYVIARRVNESFLARMLTHAARGSKPEAELLAKLDAVAPAPMRSSSSRR